MPKTPLRVAIIGAGAAGLSCALHLIQADDFVTVDVFEARERLGGRAHTAALGNNQSGGANGAAAGADDDVPVDMGAMFVCGIDPEPPANPLLPLCARHGVALRPCPSAGACTSWRGPGGKAVSRAALEQARRAIALAEEEDGAGAGVGLHGLSERLARSGGDCTVQQAWEGAMASASSASRSPGRKRKRASAAATATAAAAAGSVAAVAASIVRAKLSADFVAPPSELSFRGMCMLEGFAGHFALPSGGYGRLVAAVAAELRRRAGEGKEEEGSEAAGGGGRLRLRLGQAVLALGDGGAEGALRGVTVRWCRAAHRPQSEAPGAAAREEEEEGMAGGQAAQGASAAAAVAFDVVVCTLPLGVLQAGARHGGRALLPRGAVRFAPDVFAEGSARRGALLRLGMGVENKVWLRFALAARPGGGALSCFPGWPAGAVYVVPVEEGGGGGCRRYGKFLNLEAAMRAHAAVVPPPGGGGLLGLASAGSTPAAVATAEEAEKAAERLEAEARRARGVVLAWPTPRWARQMEETGCGMDDDAVGADAAAALFSALGVAAAAAPALVGVACSRWGADPYARGSYSFVKAGASVEDYAALAEPAWPVARGREGGAARAAARHRLRFAGEATNPTDSYTVHGAWASGEREARALLDEWRDRE